MAGHVTGAHEAEEVTSVPGENHRRGRWQFWPVDIRFGVEKVWGPDIQV